MKCQNCDSESVSSRDCPLCGGDGLYAIGSDRVCDVCDGIGSIAGEWECISCGYEWDE